MTVLIISPDDHFTAYCAGALQVHGYTAATATPGAIHESQSDILILDIPRWEPALSGARGRRLPVVVSTNRRTGYGLPPDALFYLKPVDADCMADRILRLMDKQNAPGPSA